MADQPDEVPARGHVQTAQRDLSLRSAILIFIAIFLLLVGLGTALGYRFFWDRNTQPSRLDVEEARWQAEVKRDPKSAVNWTELGVVLYNKGRLAEAEQALKKALAIEPKANRARYHLGVVYLEQQRYDQAEKELREILKRDMDNPLVFSQLAKVYAGKGDYQQALKMVDYIIKYIDPALTDIHFQRGEILEKMGKRNEAIKAYKQAASFDPEFQPARDALKRLGEKPPEAKDVLGDQAGGVRHGQQQR